MPDDRDSDRAIDQQLRLVAHSSIARNAATVDVEAELSGFQRRVAGLPAEVPLTPDRQEHSRQRARWFAAAAAIVLVVGGLVAVAFRGGDESAVVAPPSPDSTALPTVSSSIPTTATTVSTATTIAPAPEPASAEPATVVAGGVVTISPNEIVQRVCRDIVTATQLNAGASLVGQIVDGGWVTPERGADLSYPDCLGTESAGPVSFVVPVDVPAGSYEMCLTMPGQAAGCARVVVTAVADPPTDTTITEPGNLALDVGYFARRYIEEPPTFAIDRFDADGSAAGSLTDEELAPLVAHHVLPDGSTLTLEGPRPSGRCINRPLTRGDGATSTELAPELNEARSIGVTSSGVVIATRDVCPAGARWGDPGTRWEVVAFDPAGAEGPQTLFTRSADATQIQFDDGTVIVAMGEMLVDDISANGRYVALQDLYNTEDAKWHLVDLTAPGQLMTIASSCPIAGDIVGPPRFVGDGIVVVTRLCASIDTGDTSVEATMGIGDLQVEAVDLTAVDPGDAVVWHGSVPGLGADSYSSTAGLSARLAPDGTPWAIVTGGGGVETPSHTFVLHGGESIEITRDGYAAFAFDPADLVYPWDVLPSP